MVVILMKPLRARRLRYRLVRPRATSSFLANERCVTAAFCSTSLRSCRSRWDWMSIRSRGRQKNVQELNIEGPTCQGKTHQRTQLLLVGDFGEDATVLGDQLLASKRIGLHLVQAGCHDLGIDLFDLRPAGLVPADAVVIESGQLQVSVYIRVHAGDHFEVPVGPERGILTDLCPIRRDAVEALLVQFPTHEKMADLLAEEIEIAGRADFRGEPVEDSLSAHEAFRVLGHREAGPAVALADCLPPFRRNAAILRQEDPIVPGAVRIAQQVVVGQTLGSRVTDHREAERWKLAAVLDQRQRHAGLLKRRHLGMQEIPMVLEVGLEIVGEGDRRADETMEPHPSFFRKYSMVRRSPSSRPTLGSHLSRFFARWISGHRTFGSSAGSGLNSRGTCVPARSWTLRAISSTVSS